MGQISNLVGENFGRLTVIAFDGKDRHHKALWLCECVCGKSITCIGSDLKSGNSQSCGCFRKEIHTIHGMAHHPVYKVWRAMIDRCHNSNTEFYENYGGRGIRVCRLWLKGGEGKTGFQHFIEHMGERPFGYTLERRNSNLGYNPKNCYWATRKAQANNTIAAKNVKFRGVKTNLHAVARQVGISASTLHKRVFQLGWSVEKAVSQPLDARGRS